MATFLRQASQSNQITRPSLAGQTVMTNSGPYVMQGASAGGMPINPIRVATPYQFDNSGPNARQQMSNAVLSIGRYIPDNVRIQKVQQGFMGNNNPELQGGVAEVNVNGNTIRVPNALLQQMMFTDAFNQGRSNQVGEFFGGGQRPQGMQYTNYDATQQRFDRQLANNPQWTQEGALNPYERAKGNAMQGAAALQNAKNDASVMTEVRNTGGQMTGGDAERKLQAVREAEAQQKKAAQEMQQFNTTGDYVRAGERPTNMLRSMQQAFGRVTPTYSNLQIRERSIG